jgi:putative endonuclease
MTKGGAVYILTNKNNNVLYTGVTTNLPVRMYQHKFKNYHIAFTSRYSVNKLVYYKDFYSIIEAITEEKRKSGPRKQKMILIETSNPNWDDLSNQL